MGRLGLLGLVNGLKPFPLAFLLLQITELDWLWSLKADIWAFWAWSDVGRKNKPLQWLRREHRNQVLGCYVW